MKDEMKMKVKFIKESADKSGSRFSFERAKIWFEPGDPPNAFVRGPVTVRRLNELRNLVAI